MKDIELLQYVHETAEMGILGLQDIVGQVQTAKLKNPSRGRLQNIKPLHPRPPSSCRPRAPPQRTPA